MGRGSTSSYSSGEKAEQAAAKKREKYIPADNVQPVAVQEKETSPEIQHLRSIIGLLFMGMKDLRTGLLDMEEFISGQEVPPEYETRLQGLDDRVKSFGDRLKNALEV